MLIEGRLVPVAVCDAFFKIAARIERLDTKWSALFVHNVSKWATPLVLALVSRLLCTAWGSVRETEENGEER